MLAIENLTSYVTCIKSKYVHEDMNTPYTYRTETGLVPLKRWDRQLFNDISPVPAR